MTQIPPDTKDWTWVLERRCEECGLEAGAVEAAEVPGRLRAAVPLWRVALASPTVRQRPRPTVWAPLEYAAHARDVQRLMLGRLRLVLAEEDPVFPDWDQDAAATDYLGLDPAQVAGELARSAEELASAAAALRPEELDRPGRRSDGARFTARSLLQYCLHEVEHHLHDVGQRLRT